MTNLKLSNEQKTYKQENTGEKVEVLLNYNAGGKKVKRVLYKDNFGYFVKHQGIFQKVELVGDVWKGVSECSFLYQLRIGRITYPEYLEALRTGKAQMKEVM